MENKLSTPIECEEPKSTSQVVADVLAKNAKMNQFLQNVGIQNGYHRSSVLSIQTKLEVEKKANADLRLIANTKHAQIDELLQQVKET
jgi:tRNA(Phe) wybutosine-synthesizing methylase Tyw3